MNEFNTSILNCFNGTRKSRWKEFCRLFQQWGALKLKEDLPKQVEILGASRFQQHCDGFGRLFFYTLATKLGKLEACVVERCK